MSTKRYADESKIEAARQIVEYGRPVAGIAERLSGAAGRAHRIATHGVRIVWAFLVQCTNYGEIAYKVKDLQSGMPDYTYNAP